MLVSPDFVLSIGLVICLLAVPAIVSAVSDNRAPRAAAVIVLIGGGLVLIALMTKPGGYTLEQVPQAFSRTISTILR